MLGSDEWSHLGALWDGSTREALNLVWHRLKGWPDAVQGLLALKKQYIIAALSNGNVRLLVDMAKHADLPWDMIFSTELFDTFKPNPKAYIQAMHHLSLQPSQCVMVAAHIHDLRAAAGVGMKTIYVRRLDEHDDGEMVKRKDEGGEVDGLVDSFLDLPEAILTV